MFAFVTGLVSKSLHLADLDADGNVRAVSDPVRVETDGEGAVQWKAMRARADVYPVEPGDGWTRRDFKVVMEFDEG